MDDVRREAKAGALQALRMLALSFAGDRDHVERLESMSREIQNFDVKPDKPAVGSLVVIGDMVTTAATGSNLQSASSQPCRPGRKAFTSSVPCYSPASPRRTPRPPPLLEDFRDCEVLMPRVDGERRWNEYCQVSGFSDDGQLLVNVPGEGRAVKRSLHSLQCGLADDSRPLKRPMVSAPRAAREAFRGVNETPELQNRGCRAHNFRQTGRRARQRRSQSSVPSTHC